MGRPRDAVCSIAAPRALKVQSVPRASDGVKTMPKPSWTLYEPTGTRAERSSRPSSAWIAQDRVVAARHKGSAAEEGHVLRRRVAS